MMEVCARPMMLALEPIEMIAAISAGWDWRGPALQQINLQAMNGSPDHHYARWPIEFSTSTA
jgi:hypothetical protein